MPEEQDELFPPDPNAETEDDVPKIDLEGIRSAVVAGSDWTTETILRQMRVGNIDLNPRFQRRDVWPPKKKSEFIESILLNLPIPQIVLAENRGDRNTFIVLDGKQRLLSLRQFAANASETPEDKDFESLKLTGLAVRHDLNKSTYLDLGAGADKNAFDNHTIRTVVIRNWPDEEFLYRVFLRLNTGSVALSPQELRQALRPGPFMDFVDQYAIESPTIKAALGIRKPDRRMTDTEVFIRHLAFVNFLESYVGNLKPFLDDTCQKLNEDWEVVQARTTQQLGDCERAIETTLEIFGERHAFARWRNDAYERAFNRAVFDVMTYYFRQTNLAGRAIKSKKRVEQAYQALCANDVRFESAISTTTKSVGAISYRLVAWGRALEEAVKTKVPVPPWLVDKAAQHQP